MRLAALLLSTGKEAQVLNIFAFLVMYVIIDETVVANDSTEPNSDAFVTEAVL